MRSKALKLGILSLLILAAIPEQGWSYIQPAGSILASVTRRRAALGFSNIVAQGYRVRGGERFELFEAIRASRARRVELKKDNTTTVDLTVGKRRWVYKQGGPAGAPKRAVNDIVWAFLVTQKDPGGATRADFLRQHNIDTSVVSMSRLGRSVAFVVGAAPGQMDRSQIWIDKKYRAPIRLISVDRGSGEKTDIRLLGYGSGATGEWLPYRIEVYKNDKLVETTVYTKAEINAKATKSLFQAPE